VLARCAALLLHGCMATQSVLLFDELNIDSLFNELCFFFVTSYIKYTPIYIYSISQYVINGQIFD
jgi:hypothetical protein